MTKKIVLVGGGNMGEALVAGLIHSGHWKPSQITVCDVRHDQLAKLQLRYKVKVSVDNARAARRANMILLAVKPQHMKQVLEVLGPSIRSSQLILSIAAGVTTRFIEKYVARGVPVIRMMPNTPALVGQGMAAVARGRFAKEPHERAARNIMETVGKVVTVSEKAMDAVTAVSGSGPAYVFYLAEAMKDAGIQLGLAPQVSDLLVRQTVKGAGALLAQSEEDARALRERVTSPGGTTESALKVMEKAKVRTIISKALAHAAERSRELSRAQH
jgi:pyrroline-5-carboxylate reductase